MLCFSVFSLCTARYEAMIKSMTVEERENPDLLALSASRRRRIARGSGHKEAEVAELVAVFGGMRAQVGNLSKMMKLSGGMPGDLLLGF